VKFKECDWSGNFYSDRQTYTFLSTIFIPGHGTYLIVVGDEDGKIQRFDMGKLRQYKVTPLEQLL